MRDAARRFEGEHDFRNVAKIDAPNVSNFCRRIERFTVEPVSPEEGRGGCRVWALRVRGSAFLWHQVRCMAAVLLMVGRGGEAPTVRCSAAYAACRMPHAACLMPRASCSAVDRDTDCGRAIGYWRVAGQAAVRHGARGAPCPPLVRFPGPALPLSER